VATILETMTAYFRDQQWTFEQAADRPVLRLPLQKGNQTWSCYAEAHEERHRFVFYVVAPVTVPPARVPAIAELITRANYGLAIGNFELDYADGELRYKTSIDVTGDRLTQPLLHQLVLTNVRVMNHYLPAIAAVLAGTAPADALHRAGG
jgi:hypothetical protein